MSNQGKLNKLHNIKSLQNLCDTTKCCANYHLGENLDQSKPK